MKMWNFNTMLLNELNSSRMAVTALLQERDRLLYVEAPGLRKRYMELIGGEEQKILEQELELSLMRRRAELLQIAANRQEKPDMAQLEAELANERRARLQELEGGDATLRDVPELSDDDGKRLEELYGDVIRDFHPAVNRDVTKTERELYDRAAEACRHQDLEAMSLIHDVLYSSGPGLEITFTASAGEDGQSPEAVRREYLEAADELTADYSLARTLYGCFAPTQEDKVVLEVIDELSAKRRELLDAIDAMRAGFPFNARETMDDPEKTQDYLLELKVRAKLCAREREALSGRIDRLMEVLGVG